MITTNVLHRVFHIRSKGRMENGKGTCFALDKNEKRYIITALHIFKNVGIDLKQGRAITVDIYHDNGWRPVKLQLIGLDQKADIAVFTFAPDYNDTVNKMNQALYLLDGNMANVVYGQQVYFLGFPFGMVGDTIDTRKLPLPFVKSGVLTVFEPDFFRSHLFYVDGNSNPGFSGGPVVATKFGGKAHEFCVVGVLTSSCYTKSIGFLDNRRIVAEFPENTGLIKVSSINCVNEIIKANPSGIATGTFQENKQP